MIGALTFLNSRKYDRINVISSKGYHGLATSNIGCTIRVIKPSDLFQVSTESEGDGVDYGKTFQVERPKVENPEEASRCLHIICEAQDMLLNKKCRFGADVECIAILKEKLWEKEKKLLWKLGFSIA